MKSLSTLILLLYAFITAYSQEAFDKSKLEGDWYMIRKNDLLCMKIHNDTMQTVRTTLDLKVKSRMKSKFHLEKAVKLNKNIYLFSRICDTTNKIRITTIMNVDPGKQLVVAVNGISRPFRDMAKAESLLPKDTLEKFGNTYYSEAEMNRIKGLKHVADMKKPDFITFISNYLEEKNSVLKNIENRFGTAAVEQAKADILNTSLIEAGFSPFFKDEEYEKIFKKYSDDKEVKPILAKYPQEEILKKEE